MGVREQWWHELSHREQDTRLGNAMKVAMSPGSWSQTDIRRAVQVIRLSGHVSVADRLSGFLNEKER